MMHLGEARLEKCADEVAHRLRPEAFGQRRRVYNVAEQHADLLHFARQHVCSRCDRRRATTGWVKPDPAGSLQQRLVERCPALTAEPAFRRVDGAA